MSSDTPNEWDVKLEVGVANVPRHDPRANPTGPSIETGFARRLFQQRAQEAALCESEQEPTHELEREQRVSLCSCYSGPTCRVCRCNIGERLIMQGLPGAFPRYRAHPFKYARCRTSGWAFFRCPLRSIPAGSFQRLTSVLALWHAYAAHARGKLRRSAVAEFNLDADLEVFSLHRALREGCYRPDAFRQMLVRDPKLRLISVPSIRDRILHQAIVAEVDPYFRRSYIDHSYACLPGRGPGRAVLQHLEWMRRFRFRLALDIRSYFPSIAHDVFLERIVFPKLHDGDSRQLLEVLVRAGGQVYSTPLAIEVLGPREWGDGRSRGMPIGSCLSQWAANLYLDKLDHFVKRELKIAGYLRYMDDFTLFDDDRNRLVDAREVIAQWLSLHRLLELNPKHVQVHSTREGCTFLGYRVTRAGITPGEKMLRRSKINLRKAAQAGPSALARTVGSYRALFAFGTIGA